MQPSSSYTAGRLLRSNGRYSLTHLWRQHDKPPLKTKCGWTYEADEIYDGDDDSLPIFVLEKPGEPSFLRCGECFPDSGSASTIISTENRQR